jgi:voltage-gated potassium channel
VAQSDADAAARVPTRAVALTLIGMLGYVGAILATYFVMPVADFGIDTLWQAVVLSGAALGVFLLTFVGGLRRLRGSRLPILRALFLVVVLVSTYLVGFAYVYLTLQVRDPGQVPGLSTHLDGLYFTVTMLTTVGFGDISPMGQVARGVATSQMVFNLLLLGAVVRSAVQVGRAERQRQSEGSGGDGSSR